MDEMAKVSLEAAKRVRLVKVIEELRIIQAQLETEHPVLAYRSINTLSGALHRAIWGLDEEYPGQL